jgi:EAL domain-containing protein (putative c-di-GMP-specific phosphodiesterase class I)
MTAYWLLKPEFERISSRSTSTRPATWTSTGMQRAKTEALIAFGRETDAGIVAEGLETRAEMKALKHLGVRAAQGYLPNHPAPIEQVLRLAR